ncbi:MAG: tetratricopeptide repeat-containing serine protease family protein [Chloroflexota bacterium]
MKNNSGKFGLILSAILLILLFSGCQFTLLDDASIQAAAPQPSDSQQEGSAVEPHESEEQVDTAQLRDLKMASLVELQPPSDGPELSEEQIYDQLLPSIAVVETSFASTTGMLIENNYLLTSAYGIWPYTAARVYFADGSEYLNVPVHSWDLVADLALLGPIDTDVEPVPLVDGSMLPDGSALYLMGYPASAALFSQPVLKSGTLSAIRMWDRADYTFFEADFTSGDAENDVESDASNRQSLPSGLLVSNQGDVVGITAFDFNNLGLAGSMSAIVPKLNALLTLEANREPETETEHVSTLQDGQDSHVYRIDAPVGEVVTLDVVGDGVPQLFMIDITGTYVGEATFDADEIVTTLTYTVEEALPLLVTIYQTLGDEHEYTLQSSHPLSRYSDPDDEQMLGIGQHAMGSLANTSDVDYFTVELKAGERVQLYADSFTMMPEIILDSGPAMSEAPTNEASGQDGGTGGDNNGNRIGQSSELSFEAPEDGVYRFRLESAIFGHVGGYLLSVTGETMRAAAATTADGVSGSAGADGDTNGNTDDQAQAEESVQEAEPRATEGELGEIDPYNESLSTRFGSMAWYESEEYGFGFMRPEEWLESSGDDCNSPGATACFIGGALGMIVIEEDLGALPRGEQNRDGYINLLWTLFEENPAIEVTTFGESRSLQQLPLDRFVMTSEDGEITIDRLIFVDEENRVAFNLTIATSTEIYVEVDTFVDFVHDSFRFWETDARSASAAYYLDQGMFLSSTEQDAEALDALTQAIELDSTLVPAYQWRTGIYQRQGDSDAALADLDRLVELEPRESGHLYSRAVFYYDVGDLELALNDMDTAVDVDPENPENYNMRALIFAEQGDYELALAELEISEEKNGGELEPNVLDTRGFVYLLIGDFEKAKEDYDAIFDQDIRFAYALVGAGIAYYNLGEVDEGLDLLEEGMADFTAEAVENPDPQLRALLKLADKILDANE